MVTMPVEQGFVVTSKMGPRWGSHHWGTDYGAQGGSGGRPIYALKDGLVIQAGAASGFGHWIRLDHAADVGGWESVYGHIIPEVSAGQSVKEGQRIGHIDPDSRTNGGVAPHLHLEIYKSSWVPADRRGIGSTILNPQRVLAGAKWPNQANNSKEDVMLGIDISEHQDGLQLSRAKDEGMQFVIIRLCDGTYRDKVFRSHLADAEANGMLVSTYWYLRAPSEGTTIKHQVDVIDSQLGGRKDLGVWIDVESIDRNERKLLTGQDVWQAKRELERRGYHVPGIYSGAWYWENMPGGEPSMQGLGYLWVSSYGSNRYGKPRDLYQNEGGDRHPGWSYPLGDRTPDILQYGSNGNVAGFKSVDVNAFQGTASELRDIFYKDSETDNELTKEEKQVLKQVIDKLDRIERNQKEIMRQLGQPGGWEQGGKRTLYDLAAAVAAKNGVPNTHDTMS